MCPEPLSRSTLHVSFSTFSPAGVPSMHLHAGQAAAASSSASPTRARQDALCSPTSMCPQPGVTAPSYTLCPQCLSPDLRRGQAHLIHTGPERKAEGCLMLSCSKGFEIRCRTPAQGLLLSLSLSLPLALALPLSPSPSPSHPLSLALADSLMLTHVQRGTARDLLQATVQAS